MSRRYRRDHQRERVKKARKHGSRENRSWYLWDGVSFASKIEVSWAVFFTRLGIDWQYEPRLAFVNGKLYPPDFYLPQLGTYIECKGKKQKTGLDRKLRMAVEELGEPMVLVSGSPRRSIVKRDVGTGFTIYRQVGDVVEQITNAGFGRCQNCDDFAFYRREPEVRIGGCECCSSFVRDQQIIEATLPLPEEEVLEVIR